MKALPRKQKGIALFVAMAVLVVTVVLVTELIWTHHLAERRARSAFLSEQAILYALGAEAWSKAILKEDKDADNEDGEVHDHYGEVWALTLPPLPVDGGLIEGQIVDLQGQFNINDLVDATGQPDSVMFDVFVRLLQSLDIDPALASKIVDWIDVDDQPQFPAGAEDDLYTSAIPPYRSSGQKLADVSELMAIDGVDREIYQALLPYVYAIPGVSGLTINLNTIDAQLFLALDQDQSKLDWEGLSSTRDSDPFLDTSYIADAQLDPNVLSRMGVTTDYFAAIVTVNLGSFQFSMYSVLQRQQNGQVATIQRHFFDRS